MIKKSFVSLPSSWSLTIEKEKNSRASGQNQYLCPRNTKEDKKFHKFLAEVDTLLLSPKETKSTF